jgi:hypothetical protein
MTTTPFGQTRMLVDVGSRFQTRWMTPGLDHSVMFGNNSFMQTVRLSLSAPW